MVAASFVQKIAARLSTSKNYLVAYSGGLDSHVLLHCLVTLSKKERGQVSTFDNPGQKSRLDPFRLRAIHVHHGLSPHADAWSSHCQNICRDLGVECVVKHIDVSTLSDRLGVEAAARELRYQAIAEELQEGECVVTAHNQDDQAETLLLQLFRGAGPKGLAAMAEKMPFAKTELLRPLLGFTRQQLQQYVVTHKLQWIEDESNKDIGFDRNYIRQRLMPIIRERWPKIAQTVSRSASLCAEASDLLDQLGDQDLQQVATESPDCLAITALLQLEPARQRNALRYWLRQLGLPLPNATHLAQLEHDLLHCRTDAMPLIAWQGVEIRRYNNKLYAMTPLEPHDPRVELSWNLKQPLKLPETLGTLVAEEKLGCGLRLAKGEEVIIKFRQGGENCHPSGRIGAHPLKKLFQEWQVPPWQRDRIPLIYKDNYLIAVVDYCICRGYAITGQEKGIVIRWSKLK